MPAQKTSFPPNSQQCSFKPQPLLPVGTQSATEVLDTCTDEVVQASSDEVVPKGVVDVGAMDVAGLDVVETAVVSVAAVVLDARLVVELATSAVVVVIVTMVVGKAFVVPVEDLKRGGSSGTTGSHIPL